jgi:hypothetical protein
MISDDLYDYDTCPACGGPAVKNKAPDAGPANGFGARCMNPDCGKAFTAHPISHEPKPDDSQNQD